MRVNREIRAPRVRVISSEGELFGILSLSEAMMKADQMGLDLVEISPNAEPPVCKIIDYGKFRYQQTKKDKEQKKAQHHVKVKEVKVKPNTDEHDLQTKIRHAKDFITQGDKVRVTCVFRGREMMHPEFGQKAVMRFCQELESVGTPEAPPKMMGRMLSVVIAPGVKKKEGAPKPPAPSKG